MTTTSLFQGLAAFSSHVAAQQIACATNPDDLAPAVTTLVNRLISHTEYFESVEDMGRAIKLNAAIETYQKAAQDPLFLDEESARKQLVAVVEATPNRLWRYATAADTDSRVAYRDPQITAFCDTIDALRKPPSNKSNASHRFAAEQAIQTLVTGLAHLFETDEDKSLDADVLDQRINHLTELMQTMGLAAITRDLGIKLPRTPSKPLRISLEMERASLLEDFEEAQVTFLEINGLVGQFQTISAKDYNRLCQRALTHLTKLKQGLERFQNLSDSWGALSGRKQVNALSNALASFKAAWTTWKALEAQLTPSPAIPHLPPPSKTARLRYQITSETYTDPASLKHQAQAIIMQVRPFTHLIVNTRPELALLAPDEETYVEFLTKRETSSEDWSAYIATLGFDPLSPGNYHLAKVLAVCTKLNWDFESQTKPYLDHIRFQHPFRDYIPCTEELQILDTLFLNDPETRAEFTALIIKQVPLSLIQERLSSVPPYPKLENITHLTPTEHAAASYCYNFNTLLTFGDKARRLQMMDELVPGQDIPHLPSNTTWLEELISRITDTDDSQETPKCLSDSLVISTPNHRHLIGGKDKETFQEFLRNRSKAGIVHDLLTQEPIPLNPNEYGYRVSVFDKNEWPSKAIAALQALAKPRSQLPQLLQSLFRASTKNEKARNLWKEAVSILIDAENEQVAERNLTLWLQNENHAIAAIIPTGIKLYEDDFLNLLDKNRAEHSVLIRNRLAFA